MNDTTPTPSPLAEVILHDTTLYYGADTAGLTTIELAREDTVGRGVYLAVEPIARAYAQHRAARTGTAALYEVVVDHACLIDLTNEATRVAVLTDFRDEVLYPEFEREYRDGRKIIWIGALERKIAAVDDGTGLRPGGVRHVTWGVAAWFSEFLQRRGFDGVFTAEGGEGDAVPNHDTYLVIDPAKLRITSEQTWQVEDRTTRALNALAHRSRSNER